MISPRPCSSRYFTFYWTSVTLHKQLQLAWQEQVQGFLLRSQTYVYNSTLPPLKWKSFQAPCMLSPSDASYVNRPTDCERPMWSLPVAQIYSSLVSFPLFFLILDTGSARDGGGQATLQTWASNIRNKQTLAAQPLSQAYSLAELQQMSSVAIL